MRKQRKKQENHRMTGTPMHKVWAGMILRCDHQKTYKDKGITVCDEWRQSFLRFYEDMGERPTAKHQLDRQNPLLGYSKDNCRWLLPQENSRNKTNHTMFTFNGETRCLAEWGEVTGINVATIISRLDKGWDLEKTLTTPVKSEKFTESEKQELLIRLGTRNLIGKQFGRLTVASLRNFYGSNEASWNCLCDCGETKVFRTGMLTSGRKSSCGCDVFYDTNGNRLTNPLSHKYTDTPEYQAWSGIRQRCRVSNNYKKKKITVCQEWLESYEVFFQYLLDTIGLKPARSYALDRLDNTKGYCPGNIKWSTVAENNRNKSNTRLLTYNGVTKSVSAWAADMSADPDTLYERLNRGWSEEKTVTTPIRPTRKR